MAWHHTSWPHSWLASADLDRWPKTTYGCLVGAPPQHPLSCFTPKVGPGRGAGASPEPTLLDSRGPWPTPDPRAPCSEDARNHFGGENGPQPDPALVSPEGASESVMSFLRHPASHSSGCSENSALKPTVSLSAETRRQAGLTAGESDSSRLLVSVPHGPLPTGLRSSSLVLSSWLSWS